MSRETCQQRKKMFSGGEKVSLETEAHIVRALTHLHTGEA